MGNEFNQTGNKETFADANVSPLHEGEPDDLDNADISQILNGAKAVSGKALWSANGAAAMQREEAEQKEKQEHHDAETREAQELAHLAEWNAQMTTLGGVAMTNEEAQRCRQHIIDHADEYAERAVREGRISEDEKEEYKQTIQRIHELKDREGRGTITDKEKAECEHLQHSRAGQAAEHDAGQFYAQTSDQDMTAKTKDRDAKNSLRTGVSAAAIDNSFQSAPEINKHFANAVTPDRIPAAEPNVPAPANTRNVSQIAFALE